MTSPIRRIIIVDDHDAIRRGVRQLLETKPYYQVVGEASDGRSGLELARETRPDIAILDYSIPELNGLDLILELTRHFLRAKVIAISGVAEEKNVLDVAKLLGARRTIQKPFSMPQLLDAVRYELEH